MDNEIKKCEKCGNALKQSGPDAPKKKEGISSDSGPMEINYWCMSESCEMFRKNIKIFE